MHTGIQIRPIGPVALNFLLRMYNRFDPLGAALGLPPIRTEARRQWICEALTRGANVAAFIPAGDVVGHCFLSQASPDSAELAIFVHQDHRRQGAATSLIKAALALAAASGIRRVWSTTSPDNRPAVHLLFRCGFRPAAMALEEIEMEIDLRESWPLDKWCTTIGKRDLSVACEPAVR